MTITNTPSSCRTPTAASAPIGSPAGPTLARPARRLETTGHITEWLVYSLEKEQLVEPRMIKSVSYLTNLLLENRNEKWGIGPLGHGLHALAMYDERIFGGKPGTRAVELAEVKKDCEAGEGEESSSWRRRRSKAKTVER